MSALHIDRKSLYFLLAILLLDLPTAAQQQERPDYSKLFDKTDVMIAARDGAKLHTEIYAPKNATEPLPIIFERTPYGLSNDEKGYSRILYRYAEMIPEGYIFVFQDIRGRYGSEGKFVMQRPVRDPKKAKAIDEGTDTYDTIDWLVKNVPHNNGRVGLLGISYGGWLTVMGMLDPHPALKGVSEQASPADMFLGDDFHHNGAFRLSYGFEYSTIMETDKTNFSFQFDRFDTYEWYLQLGALSNANKKYIHGTLPTWNDFVAHPNYDSFWKQQAMPFILTRPKVPNLNVAGWWDQEDFYGPMKIYEILEKEDPDHLNYLVAGPWNHGGWARGAGASLGAIPFGSDTALYFRQKIEAVRLLAKEQRQPASQRGSAISDRQRHLGEFRFLAAARSESTESLFSRGRKTFLRRPYRRVRPSIRQLRQRSRASRALSQPADRHHLSRRSSGQLVHVAGAGPAFRGQPPGRAHLAN